MVVLPALPVAFDGGLGLVSLFSCAQELNPVASTADNMIRDAIFFMR
jgi:hypothetical protein